MDIQALGALAVAGAIALNQISGIDSSVATWMGTPSAANMRTAMGADRTGTGPMVFADTPTLVTPVLGAATGTSLSFGASPATIGTIRLANAESMYVRNFANSANILVVAASSSNDLLYGNTSAVNTYVTAATAVALRPNGVATLTATTSFLTVTTPVIASNAYYTATRINVAAGSADGLFLQNSSGATAISQVQNSPRIRLQGGAWNSSGGGTAEVQDWIIENRPIPLAGTTRSSFALARSYNGAAYVDSLVIDPGGYATFTNAISAPFFYGTGGHFQAVAAGSGFIASHSDPVNATAFGFHANNVGGATNNNQKWSSYMRWTGAGWNVTASASRAMDARAYLVPVQQASGEPIGELTFDMANAAVSSGAYATIFKLLSTGGFRMPTATATPPNPPAGEVVCWFDGTNMKAKDSAGNPVAWA